MKQSFVLQLGMAIPLALGAVNTLGNYALAQLNPDNTLGTESSIVLPQQLRDLIQGGAIRGNALFHSFDEFNVGDGRSVFFDLQNNADILNIFTRVTGSNSSSILGTLGVLQDALNSDVLGNANLFLLNPNGISFGGNASLQLNGSFFATTADGFEFDNFTFSASGEEAPPPLLTVSIPRVANFRDNPGDIAVNQGNLTVNQGQNISLVGGNVTVQGGQLNAPGGRIELGGMFVAGNVSLNDDFSLTFPDLVIPDSDSFELAETNATDTGKVTINADTLNLSNGVQIVSQTQDGTELGGITINATDSVNVTGFSQIRTQTNGTGSAEGITINAPNILLDGLLNNNTRSSLLVGASNSASANSNAGNLILNSNIFNISNGGQIQTTSFGAGDVGDININADEAVNFTDDGRLITQVRRSGSVGNITITSPNVLIDGQSRILPQVGTFNSNLVGENSQATGNIGNLEINAENLTFSNGSRLFVRTYSPGSIGNVTIDADQVSITGSGALFGSTITLLVGVQPPDNVSNADSSLNIFSTGNIGRLQINTRTLNLGDTNSQLDINSNQRDRIQIQSWGAGNIGDNVGNSSFVSIDINANESVNLNRRSFVLSQTRGSGEVGNIVINTPSLALNENSLIFSRTGLNFEADASPQRQNLILKDNDFTTGNSGDIILNVDTLSLTHRNSLFSNENGSSIQSQTFGAANAGNIIINATENISISSDLDSLSLIFSDLGSISEIENIIGGNITINTPSLSLRNGNISVNTSGSSNAGNININVFDTFVIDGEDSGVFATISGNSTGNPGNLAIESSQLLIQNGGQINFANAIISSSELPESVLEDNSDNLGDDLPTPVVDITLDIASGSSFTGNAGQIFITSDDLTLINNALISAQDNSGAGGFIDLQIKDFIILDNSTISAAGNQAGSLDLQSTALVMFDNSLITIDSENSVNLTIGVNPDLVFISPDSIIRFSGTNISPIFDSSLVVATPTAEVETIEPDKQISQSACYDFGGDSQLANTGRGGIPQIPGLIPRNSVVNVDLVDEVLLPAPPPEAIKPHHRTDVTFIDSQGEEYKPAMGAVLLPNGMVQFVDYNPAQVYRDMYAAAGCNKSIQ